MRRIPEYAPKYKILSSQLQKLFERAFVDGASDPSDRPDETEFYYALEEYRNTLHKKIGCREGHYMPSKYVGPCEWCRINKVKEQLSK